VSTFAGSENNGYLDSTPETSLFGHPANIAVDSRDGSIYVADKYNNVIRKIYDGVVSTVAGNGEKGFKDGGASEAMFEYPTSVAVDTYNGALYVADSFNHRIRKISAEGIVSTLAGTGEKGALDGPASKATFTYPTSICVVEKDGSIYVSEEQNNKIRKVSTDGNVMTYAGTGTKGCSTGVAARALFNGPVGLAVDDFDGALYVADKNNHKIKKILNGVVSVFAGTGEKGCLDGPVAKATFNEPTDIAVDKSDGSVFVTDCKNRKIRKISPNGIVTTVAGVGKSGCVNGHAKTAKFVNPSSIAVHGTNAFIVDDNMIRKLTIV